MGVVKTSDIKPGMVLAEDLSSPHGRFLFPEGCKLTREHVRIIKIWGVREADIQGIPQCRPVAVNLMDIDPELFSLGDEHVSRCLSNFTHEHEFMDEIYRLCLKRTVQHLATGFSLPTKQMSRMPRSARSDADESAFFNTIDPLSIIQKIHSPNTFSDTYHRINELLNSPEKSSRQVAEAISADASLEKKLLELINSPLYAFPSDISAIPQALAIMGAEELNHLILGISIFQYFNAFTIPANVAYSFWRHAILCGCIGKLLAGLLPGVTIERFFTAGLLHDIGKLAIAVAAPDLYVRTQEYAMEQTLPDFEAEQQILGFDHSLVGMLLLEQWMVPKSLLSIARHHHDPMQAELTLEPAITHLADLMTLAIDTATISPCILPTMAADVWESLCFPLTVLEPVLTQGEQQATEISRIFLKEMSIQCQNSNKFSH